MNMKRYTLYTLFLLSSSFFAGCSQPEHKPTSADTDSTIIQRYTDSARLMGYEDSALIKAYIEFKVNQNELARMNDRLARMKEFEAKKSNDNGVLFGMGFFSLVLFLLLLPSLIPAFIASHKGRSWVGLFLLSIFFTPIVGLIVALIIAPINKAEAPKQKAN